MPSRSLSVSVSSRLRDLEKAGIRAAGEYNLGWVAEYYDRFAAANPSSVRYMNFGLWSDRTSDHDAACENLLDTIVGEIECRDGKLLDVACGLGETSRYLTRFWSARSIVGINLTSAQIDACKQRVPGCEFLKMDATDLEFDSESFKNVICIEAAQHFRTRAKFLQEAIRVLSPGGQLVMTDLLVFEKAINTSRMFPSENFVKSADAYRRLLFETGYSDVKVMDITDLGWRRYAAYIVKDAHDRWFSGRISFPYLQNQLAFVYAGAAVFSANLLISARKPSRNSRRPE